MWEREKGGVEGEGSEACRQPYTADVTKYWGRKPTSVMKVAHPQRKEGRAGEGQDRVEREKGEEVEEKNWGKKDWITKDEKGSNF